LHNSNIKGNVITNNGYGIDVQMPTYTIIDSNLIAGHEVGISLWGVTVYSNNITNNDIAGNSVGFQIDGQGGNVIYQNNFINNPTQAYDPNVPYEVQVWDNGYPSGGNYWSDYTGVDNYSGPYQNETGGDGIGDIPYTINSWDVWINKDNYPRMLPLNASKYALTITAAKGGTTNPQQGAHIYYPGQGTIITAFPQTDYLFDHWELDNINIGSTNPILIVIDTNHALHTVFRPKPDIAVTGLLAYPDNVRRGQPVYIDVAVENQWYSKETFDILVYADKDKSVIGDEIIVGTQTVYRLVPGTSKTVNFIWDISTTPLGTGYYISAKATVPQDRDLSDNSLTAKKKIIIRR
jgi:hypothetical protein